MERQALMGDVIDDVEDPEPPAIGHLVMHEVQRPEGIRPSLHENGRPYANSTLGALCACARPALPHGRAGRCGRCPKPRPPAAAR